MPSSRVSESGPGSVDQQQAEARQRRSNETQPDRTRELEAELADTEDRYKRALADLDNYRKRTAREVDRRVAESRAAQLREWLDAVDSVERALAMQPDGPLLQGLRAVLEQMEAILARNGVERIGAAGEAFDPERHAAVGILPSSEVPDRTVVEVARSGFRLGDRVLRPAEVIVSRDQQD